MEHASEESIERLAAGTVPRRRKSHVGLSLDFGFDKIVYYGEARSCLELCAGTLSGEESVDGGTEGRVFDRGVDETVEVNGDGPTILFDPAYDW